MGKNVLVTGGAGFIGSHVADAYLARGDRVWVVDDLSSGRRSNLPDGVDFRHMDIRDAAIAGLFEEVGGFDIVNHHAAQIDVRRSVADPRLDASVNIDGLLNLLEAGMRHGVGRFLMISSGGVVYGEAETRPTPETAPKQPVSPYGVTKLAAEFYLWYYHRVRGLDYAALRYANVYGPRQDPHGEAGVVAIFGSRVLEEQPLTVFGDGEQTRDYVFVGDVVTANLALSDAVLGEPSTLDDRAFNVGTGVEISVNELASAVMRAGERSVETTRGPARPGDLDRSALDARRLGALGWRPETTLDEGLAKTLAHIGSMRGAA
ncbi:MAG TPA: NAD-dependent epimerase/dehydratase family protein [Longimicrobiales bacterium]|nr:NAD-dependent epimerase/dehydratase family protein [Longimicrobiales bacterium]